MDNTGIYQVPTEAPNPRTRDIDLLPSDEVVSLLNSEDQQVPLAVAKVLPELAHAVELVVHRLRSGGKVHYFGAGTSGRIAMADAAELPPTYGVGPGLFVVHQAGGPASNSLAVEHAEDDAAAGAEAAMALEARDTAIGVAASGLTPFVVGALRGAKQRGAATILVSSNPAAPLGAEVDCHVAPDTGPEAIAGSTRMKAGTATKLVLNSISTSAMIALGWTFSHYMVHMQATNTKLRNRAVHTLREVTGLDHDRCAGALEAADGELGTALTMLLAGADTTTARDALKRNEGSVRAALRELSEL